MTGMKDTGREGEEKKTERINTTQFKKKKSNLN